MTICTKTCRSCNEVKFLTEFYKERRYKTGSGVRPVCIECHNKQSSSYYKKHSEIIKHNVKKWVKNNRPRVRAIYKKWREGNKEKARARSNAWGKNNPEKSNNRTARHRAMKLCATPKWADKTYIGLWYKLAKIESIRTGKQVHVDHIVPLQSLIVCGLHTEHNLQLLFSTENQEKGNRFWPDMPEGENPVLTAP